MSETTNAVIVGRKDYGWGVEMTPVEIEGHHFLVMADGRAFVPCGHCDHGYSGSKAAFGHVLGAVCFQCGGTGVSKRLGTIEDATRIAKRRNADEARRQRKANEEAAAKQALRDEWAAANPEIAARLIVVRDETGNADSEMASYEAAQKYGEFIVSLAHRSGWAPLTEAQTAAAIEALDEHDAKIKAAAEKIANARVLTVPEGTKVEITGRVATAMNVDGYAYGSTDRLLIIEGNGEYEGMTFKIIGSGQTLWAPERGSIVKVNASVKKYAEYNGMPQTQLTRAKVTVTAQ